MTKKRDFRADVIRWKEDAKKAHAKRLHLNAEARPSPQGAGTRTPRTSEPTPNMVWTTGRVSPALAKSIASVEQGIRRYGLHGLKWGPQGHL